VTGSCHSHVLRHRGLFTGIFAWLCTCVYGLTGQGVRVTRTTPFAFGPYLEIGWVLAWIWALQ